MLRTVIDRVQSTRLKPWMREGALLLGLYWLYSSIRWLVARDGPYEAFENAYKLIQLERQLGIFYEPSIQKWLIKNAKGVIHFANVFYSLGYFPVLILTGMLLYKFSPERFHVFKLTFLLGLGFALLCFSLFPLAPPRMLSGAGFVDTQAVFGSRLYNRSFVVSFYNPYAAMPSLHFGWALLVGISLYSFGRRFLNAIGVLYPCCMAFVIVTTGHHFFLDIVGGGIVVTLAYGLVRMFDPHARDLMPSLARLGDHGAYKQGDRKFGSGWLVDIWESGHRESESDIVRDVLTRIGKPPL